MNDYILRPYTQLFALWVPWEPAYLHMGRSQLPPIACSIYSLLLVVFLWHIHGTRHCLVPEFFYSFGHMLIEYINPRIPDRGLVAELAIVVQTHTPLYRNPLCISRIDAKALSQHSETEQIQIKLHSLTQDGQKKARRVNSREKLDQYPFDEQQDSDEQEESTSGII